MAFSGNVIFHVLLAVVVAVVIYFAQQHVLYGRHIVYACSSDKGERESTKIEEDILSDNGRNISMNRKLLWPSLGFVIIIFAGLFNRSMCIELIPHDYLRQYMIIIPAVVVTTVVTNIFLGNWEHSLKPSIENCPKIIVDVNGGKELFPLMDMVDSVGSDISLKKVTKDIFILYLNTRYEILTRHTTALVKAIDELELLKMEITRTKWLFDSKALNKKSADSTAETEGFPTLQKSPEITTGKDNYRETDNGGPEYQNQRAVQGKCTSKKYNLFYIYSRRQMCISLNVSEGVNIDLDTAESSELSFKQSNKSNVYQENFDRLEKEIVIVLDTLNQSITDLHIETLTRDMKNKTSSNLTRQAEKKIQANVVYAKRRKSVQNSRKSTQDKVNEFLGTDYWFIISFVLTINTLSSVYVWIQIYCCLRDNYVSQQEKSWKSQKASRVSDVISHRDNHIEVPRTKLVVPRVSVAVITFRNGTESVHVDIVKSIMNEEMRYPIKTVTIKRNDDLYLIPRSKVAFVFVDFNERNIILEDSNEKNKLKLTTVEHIFSSDMDVVIIYCFDTASQNLEQLYAPKLITVSTHPVLVKLQKKECVLSVYKELSSFQKTHLRNKLKTLFSF